MAYKIPKKYEKKSGKYINDTMEYVIPENEVESSLKYKCKYYKIDYNKNKKQIWELLDQKVKDTGEPITDIDVKGVCKFIAEND